MWQVYRVYVHPPCGHREELAGMDEWDREIEVLRQRLAELRTARDAAAPGSELFTRYQAEADQVSYRWSAYRLARPVLAALYEGWEATSTANDRYAQGARDDASAWGRVGLVAGIIGMVVLVSGVRLDLAWWFTGFGVLALIGCACALFAAFLAHRDEPDNSQVSAIVRRITAIERACKDCWSAEALDAVESLINPQPTGTVARIM